jgi:hypothetical protein
MGKTTKTCTQKLTCVFNTLAIMKDSLLAPSGQLEPLFGMASHKVSLNPWAQAMLLLQPLEQLGPQMQ